MDRKLLKKNLQSFSSTDPLYLVFKLSNQLPEIDEISQPSDLENDIFSIYSANNGHFVCIQDDIESFNTLSPSTFQQIIRLIKKSHKNNLQTLGIVLDARHMRISESNELFLLGQNVRMRVDAIRNDTTFNIPIVLVIRNMEDIEGFESWTQQLSELRLDEAFGFAVPDEEIEAQSFISAAFRSISDQLSPTEQSSEVPSHQFMQSLMTLKKNLVALTNGLIQTQPDLVPPKFIGLYFMGMINHPVHQSDDDPDDNPVLIQKPAFVKDVFTNIFSQAASYRSYYQPETNHGFLYKSIILSIAVCLIMSIAGLCLMYKAHKNTLQNTYTGMAMLQKNITTPHDAIGYFDSLSHYIVSLDTTISGWWLPWFGFSSKKDPVKDLKQKYVGTFRKYLLKPLIDQFMENLRNHLSKRSGVKDADQEFHQNSGQYMGTLVFYIDFINQFMKTRQKESFAFTPTAYQDGRYIFIDPISQDRFKLFMNCYTNALIWSDNRRSFRKDVDLLQTSVEEMVALLPDFVEWAFPIVNEQQKNIDLLTLWIKSFKSNKHDTIIKAAFTRDGYAYIQNVFKIIRQAHSIPAAFDAQSKVFYKNYEITYLQVWEQAVKKFDSLSNFLETREAWVDIVLNLHDVQKNPYFQLIDMIVEHMQPFLKHQKKWPQWLQLCYRLHNQTVLSNESNSLTLTSNQSTDSETANVFNGYLGALKNIAQLPNTPDISYQMIKTFFANPGTFCPGEGPETIACLSIFQLQSIWNKKDQDNAAFWELYEGPVNLIRKFSMRETACQLQQNWEDMVLSVNLQVGNGSLVQKQKAGSNQFLQTYASPFLEKITQTRYVPKRLAGLVVPFREEFFKYIAYHPRPKAALKERYPVIIKATPSRTNTLATSQPQLTLIKMKCNQNQQIMVIGHQPAHETFYWSENCGPVHVTFHLKDMKLTRSYPNPMAFPKFIRDVQYGSKRFHRSEFVLDRARLKSMNIEYVELKLQLFGHESIAKAQERGFMTAPERITYCWEKSKQQAVSDTSEKSKPQKSSVISEKTKQTLDLGISKKPEIKEKAQKELTSEAPKTQTEKIDKPDIRADADVYIVILASFREDSNAVNKARRLKKKGLQSEIYWLKDNNEKPWYIIVSGMYASYDEAMKSVDQIKTRYSIMPFIKKMEKQTIEERKVNIHF